MRRTAEAAPPLELGRTDELWREAIARIPTGAQTFSKAPFQHVAGVSPRLLARAEGCRVWDPDGNEYIDYMLGLGPVILGHADAEVNAAVGAAMQEGIAMPLPHPMEAELARELCDVIPCAEMVRFGKNGSDATAGAVRAARAITGRDVIACCGYHGWQDWYIGSTGRFLGVPDAVRELTVTFEYNEPATLERLFMEHPSRIAAVIMEPVNFHEPEDDFLSVVRDLTHENGALLIFDEIITGFRMAMGGAQEYYDVVPDLACFGKAMGNGMPISAIVGPRQHMQIFEEIFYSFTFGGELASIAASLATLRALRERDGLGRIWAMGRRLMEGFDELVAAHDTDALVTMIGFPFWPEYVFEAAGGFSSREIQSLFQQEIVRRGILTRAGMFISAAHGEEEIDRTLEVFDGALGIVKGAVQDGTVLDRLEGEVITPVIRSPEAEEEGGA